MMRRFRYRLPNPIAAGPLLAVMLTATPLSAQWVKYPTSGVPRKPDGTVNMSAPAPRMTDGKPDFSGIWTSDGSDPRKTGAAGNPVDAIASRQMANIGVDIPGGLPYQDWLKPIV